MSFLPGVKAWLILSAVASGAGWILSALGHLDRLGYSLSLCLGLVLLWFFRKQWWSRRRAGRSSFRCLRTRFRRLLPGAFALLCFLILLGGLLYPPTNHTAMTYRIPRVLHWLAEHHWHWIGHTENYRMNNRACGIEWLSAPLLLFFRSDRALFLLNFLPFVMLPGLIYSLFTRLGVRPRVAWFWMWLLPTGYNFVLQAGSAANDTFPTVYALAAVDFACRAWVSRKPSDLWFSLLAAALVTGAKASNLPLLLPWCIAALASWRVWFQRPFATVSVIAVGALVSFLPNAILNLVYCGDWSGLNLERTGMDMKNPIVGIWGNGLLFLLHNFVPPFFPLAGWWNQSALTVLPQPIVRPLVANFEQSFHQLWEMPSEDWVGLGFGVSLLLLVSWLAGWKYRNHRSSAGPGQRPLPEKVRAWILLAPWAALLVFCMKSGMVTGARLISPYYPLLAPLLLLGTGQVFLVRKGWWKWLAGSVVVVVFPVLMLTPGRPLWPAQTILSRLASRHPEYRLVGRAATVYKVYAIRSDPLAEMRALLPATLSRIGFVGAPDDTDISLWRPLGGRRVEHILFSDSGEQIRQRHLEYAVVGGLELALQQTTIEAWLRQTGAKLLATTQVTVKVAEGAQSWYLVQFPD
jgi:hypothetical protein